MLQWPSRLVAESFSDHDHEQGGHHAREGDGDDPGNDDLAEEAPAHFVRSERGKSHEHDCADLAVRRRHGEFEPVGDDHRHRRRELHAPPSLVVDRGEVAPDGLDDSVAHRRDAQHDESPRERHDPSVRFLFFAVSQAVLVPADHGVEGRGGVGGVVRAVGKGLHGCVENQEVSEDVNRIPLLFGQVRIDDRKLLNLLPSDVFDLVGLKKTGGASAQLPDGDVA
mmetsp:Transcript_1474/g.6438  ORF Transcript_1474/g.6438 Transcript_1474/m.6438 type:complete len:224 (+) Transcript_1474:191-862(+)